ncbi:MAG: hypothetical protein ACTSSH_05695, partial [Candidatus Heimdallarchaeota archaeon]
MTPSKDDQTAKNDNIATIKKLIAGKDEVNLEWLKTVTQLSLTEISKIIIQEFGMIVLEGVIYSKTKAERKLKQKQEDAKAIVDREDFRKGPVKIDMMQLREKFWTVYLPERIFGQERHQFCPIWAFLEGDLNGTIVLRYDWFDRLEKSIQNNVFSKSRKINALQILNEYGDDFKGKSKAIFAKTYPRDSLFEKNKPIWVIFLVSSIDGG